MTITLTVDSNNDLIIGPTGALSMSSELEAVLLACAHAAKTQLGEMVFRVDQGLPNFDAVWQGSPNLTQFEAYLRRALLAVEGVTSVEALSVANSAGVLAYQATIATVYGSGALNG
jgi:hypothetical protein